MRLRFYRDRKKQWRWTLVAPNGRKLANAGEGYARRVDCERMARTILQGVKFTESVR